MPDLLLIRHGQSTWNAESRWQGQADPQLSELGERQALAAAPAVVAWGPSRVVASDLLRARATAELLVPAGIAVELEPELRERDAGEWTGLTRAEIEGAFPGALAEHRRPADFESDESLLARALRTLERLVAGDDDAPVVVVTHGGVVRAVERHVRPDLDEGPLPNLGGRRLSHDGAWRLGDRVLLVPDDLPVTTPPPI